MCDILNADWAADYERLGDACCINMTVGGSKWMWGIVVGQVVAVLGALSGSGTEALGEANLPMIQSTCTYLLLCIVFGSKLLSTQKPLANCWYKYLGIALIDVMATYSTIAALTYTSVTSWSLLTASGVVLVVPLSWLLLKARYTVYHFVGIAGALLGMVVLVAFDSGDKTAGSNPLWGDILVLFGSLLYGVNAVWEELLLKEESASYELLGMLGSFGTLFGACATFGLQESWADFSPSPWIGLLRLSTVCTIFLFYALFPMVLTWSGATVLQMSLLASTVWSTIARLVFFGGFGSTWWAFLISTALIFGGLVMYTWAGEPYSQSGKYYALEEEVKPKVLQPSASGSSELEVSQVA